MTFNCHFLYCLTGTFTKIKKDGVQREEEHLKEWGRNPAV